MIVRAEQKGKGVGRGSYPIDEEKSKQLKLVADKMDAFFAHSDEAAFDAVASPDITLHGDLLILDNDLSGADKVKQTLGTYTNAYDYKHENIAHGADIDGSSVFHFWLHQVGLQVWLLVGVVAQQSAALQVCLHVCVIAQQRVASQHAAYKTTLGNCHRNARKCRENMGIIKDLPRKSQLETVYSMMQGIACVLNIFESCSYMSYVCHTMCCSTSCHGACAAAEPWTPPVSQNSCFSLYACRT